MVRYRMAISCSANQEIIEVHHEAHISRFHHIGRYRPADYLSITRRLRCTVHKLHCPAKPSFNTHLVGGSLLLGFADINNLQSSLDTGDLPSSRALHIMHERIPIKYRSGYDRNRGRRGHYIYCSFN